MNLNKFTLFGSLVGIILASLGLIMENQQINYFWEARDIGFAFLILSIGLYLNFDFTFKFFKVEKESRQVWIGFFQVIFSVIFIGQLLFANFSTSLAAAKEAVINNKSVTNEIGNINGFGILINGFPVIISKREAYISLLVKGEQKFGRYLVELESNEGSWQLKKLKRDR